MDQYQGLSLDVMIFILVFVKMHLKPQAEKILIFPAKQLE